MNFIIKPPLEHIALVKIAALLWNHSDIRALVSEFLNSPCFLHLENSIDFTIPTARIAKWQRIEDHVTEHLQKLVIPACLKVKLLGYIQAVGLQILKWLEYHLRYSRLYQNICFELGLPTEFYWTPQGTIDQKKTVDALIKDEQLDITTRYKLACIYCLEENIPELWNKLPQIKKESLYDEEDPRLIFKHSLFVFWGFYVHGKLSELDEEIRRRYNVSSYVRFLLYCMDKGNKVAFKYFWKILNPTKEFLVEKAISLLNTNLDFYFEFLQPPKEYYTEIFCLLLSKMNNEQQLKVFEKHPVRILVYLLDWPWQGIFVEAASHLWSFLSEDDFNLILTAILQKEKSGFKDYDYQKVFQDFWQQIPHANKRNIINNDYFPRLLYNLLQMKHKENVKSIFQDTTHAEKTKILYSDMVQFTCINMITADEWDFLKFFFQVCITSKDEMTEFKQVFQKSVQSTFKKNAESARSKYGKFYSLLDDCVSGYDKRKIEDEEDSNSAKKLC